MLGTGMPTAGASGTWRPGTGMAPVGTGPPATFGDGEAAGAGATAASGAASSGATLTGRLQSHSEERADHGGHLVDGLLGDARGEHVRGAVGGHGHGLLLEKAGWGSHEV